MYFCTIKVEIISKPAMIQSFPHVVHHFNFAMPGIFYMQASLKQNQLTNQPNRMDNEKSLLGSSSHLRKLSFRLL